MKTNHIIFGACIAFLSVNQLFSYIHFDINHPVDALHIAKRYLPQNPVIIEAGANEGLESIFMAKMWPAGTVHSFEPVPELYKTVVANTKALTNIRTYQLALSNNIGTAKFYVSETSGQPNIPSQSSSLLAPKDHLIYAPQVLFKKAIEVKTTTIDAWAEEHKIEKVDCLWLDMQGSELSAMMAAPKVMKSVKVILTEVEFVEAYKGQPLYPDVKAWLEAQGFQMIALDVDLKHPYWFGDILFVRI